MWKINKIVPTRCHILRLKCTKFKEGWGGKGREGKGREGKGRDPLVFAYTP